MLTRQSTASYPSAPPELTLPELDGKTQKMYRGGKICTDTHFKPLWAKNAPRFGIAHALALGLGPWLAAEVPFLIAEGRVEHTSSTKGGDAATLDEPDNDDDADTDTDADADADADAGADAAANQGGDSNG